MPLDRRDSPFMVPLLAGILVGLALVIAFVPMVKDLRIQIRGGCAVGLETELPPARVSLAQRWWIERENRRMFEEIIAAAERQNELQKWDADRFAHGCSEP
jgi:hypothetical protein